MSTLDKAIDMLVRHDGEECDDVLQWLESCYQQLLDSNIDESLPTTASNADARTVAVSQQSKSIQKCAGTSPATILPTAVVAQTDAQHQNGSDVISSSASTTGHRSIPINPTMDLIDSDLESIRNLIEMDHEYAKIADYEPQAISPPVVGSQLVEQFSTSMPSSSMSSDQEMLDFDSFLNDTSSLLSPLSPLSFDQQANELSFLIS